MENISTKLQTLIAVNRLLALEKETFNLNEKIKWMDFYWDGDTENPKDAILLQSKIDTLDFKFNWQFDTGSPYTFLYGDLWRSFADAFPYLNKKFPLADTLSEGHKKMMEPKIFFGTIPLTKKTVYLLAGYGDYIDKEILYANYGASLTIGIDQFRNGVLIIDFRNNKIGYSHKFTDNFYSKKSNTVDFILYMNRIILPVTIGNKTYPFFYDSGASLFPIKTTLDFKKDFPPMAAADTLYNITTWGKSYDVPGMRTNDKTKIGSATYKDVKIYVHPDSEKYHTEIFREAGTYGLIGNQLFENKIIIIDFTRMKFTIVN